MVGIDHSYCVRETFTTLVCIVDMDADDDVEDEAEEDMEDAEPAAALHGNATADEAEAAEQPASAPLEHPSSEPPRHGQGIQASDLARVLGCAARPKTAPETHPSPRPLSWLLRGRGCCVEAGEESEVFCGPAAQELGRATGEHGPAAAGERFHRGRHGLHRRAGAGSCAGWRGGRQRRGCCAADAARARAQPGRGSDARGPHTAGQRAWRAAAPGSAPAGAPTSI